MKKVGLRLIAIVAFLLLLVAVSSAQEPFREGATVSIKKEDGMSLSGSIVHFPGEITIKSEIGFETKIDLRKTYRIKVLPQKMQDRRMLEFYLTDGKVLRGIYCCGIVFEVDLGQYGVQKFDINYPSRFHVEEIATQGALGMEPSLPSTPSMPQIPQQVQKIESPPFTILVFPSPITWHDAASQCQQRGLQIASIHSPQENFTITNQLKTINWPPNVWHGAWIGLTDENIEGMWQWNDGSPVDFTNFGPASGEPNGGTSENYGA
ncbi:MAG: C-type lectin domain-containing protein, partial [Nitrospirae bacterium]